eukprot:CAMPEP_0206037726 /NCGR_PEP_ID=MMETSP1466-20131121/3642_1 /ASSEMBLY_ACC=CAM_ASM_001126 /TAXON_ID=44452 /ORGANISM="Pavlova gyrans, Strain CCMP608" /LENGTH=191 /DNA_ID=CAMNT_0053412293 /DNA_START=42 /DNA_END=617 /DNA_ORIENTATION=+
MSLPFSTGGTQGPWVAGQRYKLGDSWRMSQTRGKAQPCAHCGEVVKGKREGWAARWRTWEESFMAGRSVGCGWTVKVDTAWYHDECMPAHDPRKNTSRRLGEILGDPTVARNVFQEAGVDDIPQNTQGRVPSSTHTKHTTKNEGQICKRKREVEIDLTAEEDDAYTLQDMKAYLADRNLRDDFKKWMETKE